MNPKHPWLVTLCGVLTATVLWSCGAGRIFAQELPTFARVQALPKTVSPVIATDQNGESLVAFRLYSNDPRMLGSTALPAHSTGLVTVARLDRAGNAVWFSGYFTGLADIRPQALAVDHHSNVILFAFAGVATNSFEISLDGTSLFSLTNVTGQAVSFLVKWNSKGEMLWAKPVGRFQYPISTSTGLAIDSTNSIYVTGGCGEGTNQTQVACKLDAEGNFLWQVPEVGSSALGISLVVDGSDALYVTGVFAANVLIGGVSLTNTNSTGGAWYSYPQSFVAKFGASGDLQWIRQGTSNSIVQACSMALDSRTNLIVVGTSGSSNIFGATVYRGPKTNSYDATYPTELFVAKLDSDGETVWVRQVADSGGTGIGTSVGLSVAVDAVDSIYAGGAIDGPYFSAVQFAGIVLSQRGFGDALLVKLDSAGNPQWAQQAGNPGDSQYASRDAVHGLTLSPDGLIAIGGFTASNATFGSLSASAGNVATTIYDICTFIALISHPAPPLATELTSEGLKLSWSTFPPEFELETASSLGSPILWSSNTAPVMVTNGTNCVTLPLDDPARYFRLRKPIP